MSLTRPELAIIAHNRRRAARVEAASRARALREANLTLSPRERLVRAGLLYPLAPALVLATLLAAQPACAQEHDGLARGQPPGAALVHVDEAASVAGEDAWETHVVLELVRDPADGAWYVVLWEPGQPGIAQHLDARGERVWQRLLATLRQPTPAPAPPSLAARPR